MRSAYDAAWRKISIISSPQVTRAPACVAPLQHNILALDVSQFAEALGKRFGLKAGGRVAEQQDAYAARPIADCPSAASGAAGTPSARVRTNARLSASRCRLRKDR